MSRVFEANIPPFVPSPGPFLLLGRFIVDLFKPSPPAKTPERPSSIPQSTQDPSSTHINQQSTSASSSSKLAKKEPSTQPGRTVSNSSLPKEGSFFKHVISQNVSANWDSLPANITEQPPQVEFSSIVRSTIDDFIKEGKERDSIDEILSLVSIPEGSDSDLYLMSLIREAQFLAGSSNEQKTENLLFVATLKNQRKTTKLPKQTKDSLTNSFNMMEDPLARGRLVHTIASIDQIALPTSQSAIIALERSLVKKSIPNQRGDYEIDCVNHFIGTLLYPKEDWIDDAVTFLRENEYIGDVPLFFHLVKEEKTESPETSMTDIFTRVVEDN